MWANGGVPRDPDDVLCGGLPLYTPGAVTENIDLTVKFLISEKQYEKELRSRHSRVFRDGESTRLRKQRIGKASQRVR